MLNLAINIVETVDEAEKLRKPPMSVNTLHAWPDATLGNR
jgi:hypothetical protein